MSATRWVAATLAFTALLAIPVVALAEGPTSVNIVLAGAFSVAFGFLVPRWQAILVPVVIGAGLTVVQIVAYSTGDGSVHGWVPAIFLSPFPIPAIAAGVLARRASGFRLTPTE